MDGNVVNPYIGTPPTAPINAIKEAQLTPSSATNTNFNVTFWEPLTALGLMDQILPLHIWNYWSVYHQGTPISTSIYTVTVNTVSGNCSALRNSLHG